MSLSNSFDTSSNSTNIDAPVKPFRMPAKVNRAADKARAIWASVYDDKKELIHALVFSALLVCVIAGSLVGKSAFTFLSLAVFVLAIIAYSISDLWKALLLYIGYLAFEGLYKYTSHFNSVVYAIAPLLAIWFCIAWYLSFRNANQRKNNKPEDDSENQKRRLFQSSDRPVSASLPAISPIVFALLALSFLQAFNPEAPSIASALLGGVVWYIAPIMMLFVTYFCLQRFKQVMALSYVLLCVSVVVSAYAIFQFKMGQDWCNSHIPGIEFTNHLGWFTQTGNKVESGSFRPISTFPQAGAYAPFSSCGLLAGLAIFLLPRTQNYRRILSFLGLSVMAIAIIVSGVRATFMALLIAVTVLLSLNVKNLRDAIRIYASSVGIAMLLIVAFMVTDATSGGKFGKRYLPSLNNPLSQFQKNRGGNFELLVQSIMVRPLGVGVQRATGASLMQAGFTRKELLPLNNRESQWNSINVDLGIFGVICIAIFCIEILRRGFIVCKTLRDPNLRAVAAFMYAMILMTIIQTLAGPAFQGNALFWMMCGALLALPRVDAEERRFVQEKVSESMITEPAVVTA